MIKNIKDFFFNIGYYKKEIEDYKNIVKTLESVIDRQQEQIKEGTKHLRVEDGILIAGFDDTECEPTDEKERKAYISEVDAFFESVLGPKLKVSIAEVRQQLGYLDSKAAHELGLTREQYDYALRGMEAMAWKIHEWAVGLQAERRSNLQEEENNK